MTLVISESNLVYYIYLLLQRRLLRFAIVGPELSFATQIVHVNMDSKDQSKLYEPIKELDIMFTQVSQNQIYPYLDILTHALGYHDHSFARADISKLSFLRVVLKPLLNLILTVKTSCFSPYSILVLLEIFGMFGELSINYKLTGEAMYISWEECINLREVKVSYLMNDCINLLEESDVQNWCFQVFSCMPQRGYFHRDLKSGTRKICSLKMSSLRSLILAWPGRSIRIYRVCLDTLVHGTRRTDYSHMCTRQKLVNMWATGAILTKVVVSSLFLFPEPAKCLFNVCSVIGIPTKETWLKGLNPTSVIDYQFPHVMFAQIFNVSRAKVVSRIFTFISLIIVPIYNNIYD
ncbi:hypothetical protein HID58_067401 [Brassica napus]|uniref:Uncharacterized protein n=1 Tax=Brassica napus TaxID=3708 RepID=A0ABQ7ZIE7_BRANA|nr:hypothetical protein HID58_067401 [Brassica napus]